MSRQKNSSNDEQQEGFFNVTMSNGMSVNIMTQEGADAFLTNCGPSTSFIRCSLATAMQMRNTLNDRSCTGPMKRQAQEQLFGIYALFGCVADSASEDVFQAQITSADLEALVDHARDVFTELAGMEIWKRTGVLTKYDQELLTCFVPFNKYERVTKLMLNGDGSSKPLLKVLAELCAARTKPQMFGAPVAETVCSIVINIQINLRENFDENKTFKKLEACGILAQVFRAITVPLVHPEEIPRILGIFDWLHRSERVVRKKLRSGTPTGDILDDVIQGRDGYLPMHSRNQDVVTGLKDLRTSSNMFNNKSIFQGCHQCSKRAMDGCDLSCCSRCKNTYYCSRECQVADWPSHKKLCHKGNMLSKGHQSMVMSFIQSIYYDLLERLVTAMQQHGVPKSDLCVQIDFYKGEGQASSPAHQKEFFVIPIRDILEGSRPAEPDWFWRGTDVYEKHVSSFLEGLRDHCTRDTANHLLCIVRFTDATSGVYRVHLASSTTGKSLVSQEVCDAFLQNDYDALKQVFGEDSNEYKYVEKFCIHREMLSVAQRAQDFMKSDEWRRMQEEFGDDEDYWDEDDDEDENEDDDVSG